MSMLKFVGACPPLGVLHLLLEGWWSLCSSFAYHSAYLNLVLSCGRMGGCELCNAGSSSWEFGLKKSQEVRHWCELKPKGSYDGKSVGRAIAIVTRAAGALGQSEKSVLAIGLFLLYGHKLGHLGRATIIWEIASVRPNYRQFLWEHFLDLWLMYEDLAH